MVEGPGEDDGQDEQQTEQGTAEFNESVIAGCEAEIGDPWEGSARVLLSLEAIGEGLAVPLVLDQFSYEILTLLLRKQIVRLGWSGIKKEPQNKR